MKKHGFRITIFILSLMFGVSFVWLINLSINKRQIYESKEINPNLVKDLNIENEQHLEIGIKFKEFVQTENQLVADFEITNYSTETFIYRAVKMPENEGLNFVQAELKFDGEKIEQWRCGTGYTDYELKSGETKIFRYNTGLLGYFWKKDLSVQIGFNFREKSFIVKDYQTYWSENIQIPDSIAKHFLKEQKK